MRLSIQHSAFSIQHSAFSIQPEWRPQRCRCGRHDRSGRSSDGYFTMTWNSNQPSSPAPTEPPGAVVLLVLPISNLMLVMPEAV